MPTYLVLYENSTDNWVQVGFFNAAADTEALGAAALKHNKIGKYAAADVYEFNVQTITLQQQANLEPATMGPPDTEAPPTPTGLTATVTGTDVGLDWNDVTGIFDLAGYRVYRDNTLIASPTGSAYADAGLAPGTYSYTVSAYDTNGNESAQTAAVSATVV